MSDHDDQQAELPLSEGPVDVWEAAEATGETEGPIAEEEAGANEGQFEGLDEVELVGEEAIAADESVKNENGQAIDAEALTSEAPSISDYMPARAEAVPAEAVSEKSVEESAASEASDSMPTSREGELLSLIRDLNECNDALLAQVSVLEDDLRKAKSEASAEVEKASAAVQLAHEKMNRQVSMEQAAAQQVSQTAQQQVARLVGELDTAEQTLSRQVLVNENLKTELSEAQARITQLEKECALASQKHAEEVQARVQAENKSRDLRSRLQRQQRYTLQFKAALEKSLTVGTSSVGASTKAHPVSFNQPTQQSTGVSMPRSQRIMPWAGATNPSAFQGIDPHLESLIRRSAKPNGSDAIPSELSTSPTNNSETRVATELSAEAVSPEAEARLWQDLERVMSTESEQDTPPQDTTQQNATQSNTTHQVIQSEEAEQLHATEASVAEPSASQESVSQESVSQESASQEIEAEQVQPSEAISAEVSPQVMSQSQPPRLNWLAEAHQKHSDEAEQDVAQTLTDASTEVEAIEAVTTLEEPALEEPALEEIEANSEIEANEAEAEAARQVDLNHTALTEALAKAKRQAQLDATESDKVAFTEPSPWGNPLGNPIERTSSQKPILRKQPVTAQAATTADYLPAVDGGEPSRVSPVANPLRPQKKIASLASVELPTFPSAKSSSFKR